MNTPTEQNPAHRLEVMLRAMEQILWYCYWAYINSAEQFAIRGNITAAEKLKSQVSGAVKNYTTIRPKIMSQTEIQLNEFTMSQTISEGEFGGKGLIYSQLPWMIQRWCWASRKVFTLSEDLQKYLELASVGQMKWQDVTFPFPSFLVKLPVPIMIGTNGHKQVADTLLVCRGPDVLYMVLIGNDTDKFRPFKPEGMKLVEELVNHRRYGKAYRLLKDLPKECLWSPGVCVFTLPTRLEAPIADILGMDITMTVTGESTRPVGEIIADMMLKRKAEPDVRTVQTPEEAALALRITVGLCLYLGSLRSGERNRVVKPAGKPIQKWNTVTDGADICEVESIHQLNKLEQDIHKRIREVGIRRALEELGVHGRTAYWRRPPGQGNNPNAPQSVHVRWAIVGLNHLPEGALPVSREVVVEMFKK